MLIEQTEKYMNWAVDTALGLYERVEMTLAVIMLKCLRPLGVREASEVATLCPNMKQVPLDAIYMCICILETVLEAWNL